MKPFVYHNHIAQCVDEFLVVDRQPAANVDQIVLFGTHPSAIRVTAELVENGGDGFFFISLFTLLYKESVLHHAGGIKVDGDTVTVAERAQCPYVGHAHRLASRHVYGSRQADIGNVLRPDTLYECLQLV